jgi:PAS domain S-box-containing protein
MAWTYDANGVLDYVNAAWTAYTGRYLADCGAADAPWTDVLPAADAEAFAASLAVAMSRGKPFRTDVRLRHGHEDGDSRMHTITIVPHRTDDDRIASWIGIAVDIERRVRAESALAEREAQYHKELARSTSFQRAVLPPHLPMVKGLAFDAIYEPGLSDENVGGDWYDAVRLLDGRVMLTIGDVAGSGLNAAVVMGVVRQIMRGIAQLHAEPALMLDAADRALRLEYPETLVTAWVGIVDLVSRTVTYASAGHPPPLLLDRSGRVTELDHLTLPIGLRQGHQGHASTIALADGSAIWLYTDGLIEATHDILRGTQILEATAKRLSTEHFEHPAAVIRRLVIPQGAQDDVAILVAQTDFVEAERYLTRSSFETSDAFAARAARRAFAASLPPSDYSDIDIANAEIVFGELCGNAVRYAPGRVDIVVDWSGIQAVLHVLDRGPGFRHLSRLPIDVLAEHGRGLYIIAAMTTEFTIAQRIGGGSHARAVLVGRRPASLLRDQTLPSLEDQIPDVF